jgi:hypothetical protein
MEFIGVYLMANVNWEKISVYIAIMVSMLTIMIYIADMKERIAKLEVKVEHLEDRCTTP